MEKKKQLVMIGGAGKYLDDKDFYYYLREEADFTPHKPRKKWRDWLAHGLWGEYESIQIPMPNGDNADYQAWKIVFERHFEFLNNEDLVLTGHSLGASFLLKYLSENELPYKARQVHLVSSAFRDESVGYNEGVGDFASDIEKIPKLADQAEEIFLYHSKDDDVCAFEDSVELSKIIPGVKFQEFDNRGHFLQSAFPELFVNIPSEIF